MLFNLTAALALIPATGVPLTSAPTEPAPTNVRLSWTSEAHARIAVTWDETGDSRNLVEVVSADEPPESKSYEVEAGQPNRLEISKPIGTDRDYVVRVTVVDAANTVLSPPASSPGFDTDRPLAPRVTSAVPRIDGSIRFSWAPARYTDPNPGDPLDLPAAPVSYQPVVSVTQFNAYIELGPAVSGAGSAVVPGKDVRAPVVVGARTSPNEWGDQVGGVEIAGTRLTAAIPATATTGGTLTVTGKAIKVSRLCYDGPCDDYEEPRAGRKLQLQARPTSGGAWKPVVETTTSKDGGYTVTAAFTGTRAYRVVAQPVAYDPASKVGDVYGETPTSTVTGVASPAPGNGGDIGGGDTDGGDSGGGDNGDNNGGSDGGGTGDGGEGGGLPITGAPVTGVAVAGGLLVLLGAVLVMGGRLRRRFQS